MRSKTQIRVASLATMLLGVWIAISPLFISITGAALTNSIVVGSVLGVLGALQYFLHNSIPSWVNLVAAMWLFVSAFAFNVSTSVATNEIISSLVAAVLALWDSNEVEQTYRPLST